MKLPLSWLKVYVDYDCSVEELMKKLFSCGFEVEEVVCLGENIDKIVTCKIIAIDKPFLQLQNHKKIIFLAKLLANNLYQHILLTMITVLSYYLSPIKLL